MIRVNRDGGAWQVILADLALILFITTLTGLVAVRGATLTSEGDIAIEPAQAIFRKEVGAPTLSQWLALEEIDPRAQLTVQAFYDASDKANVLRDAQSMWEEARGAGFDARLIVEPGEKSDVVVSFAYDKQ